MTSADSLLLVLTSTPFPLHTSVREEGKGSAGFLCIGEKKTWLLLIVTYYWLDSVLAESRVLTITLWNPTTLFFQRVQKTIFLDHILEIVVAEYHWRADMDLTPVSTFVQCPVKPLLTEGWRFMESVWEPNNLKCSNGKV